MPLFIIQHITQYQYSKQASYSANRLMLYPLRDQHQEVISHEILISDNPQVSQHQDYYGNTCGTFTLIEPHFNLTIDSRLKVLTHKPPLPSEHADRFTSWLQLEGIRYRKPYLDFLSTESRSQQKSMLKVLSQLKESDLSPLQLALKLNTQVFETFTYVKGLTTVETSVDEVWEHQSGVCQDFAHVLLELLRMSGIPARYVSGYICPHHNGMRGEGATHAWVECYLPDFGWLGLDPTNNCIPADTHVRLAVGRNFNDCSPVKGTYRGSAHHELFVSVQVAYEDGITFNDQSGSGHFRQTGNIEAAQAQSQQ